jgi:hypothetical protein
LTLLGIVFDATDISVASTTIATGAYGLVIYDDTLSPKAIIAAVSFGGSSYINNAGTFGITWDNTAPASIWKINLHN